MKLAKIIEYKHKESKYYRFKTMLNGKVYSKSSTSLETVKKFRRDIVSSLKSGNIELYTLNTYQMLDVKTALSLLPEGVSLEDCVRNYGKAVPEFNTSTKSLPDAKDEFLENKKDKVKDHYYKDIKCMVTRFANHFGNWEKPSSESFMRWVRSLSEKTKTQKHYFNSVKEFYDFSVKKGYCNNDIFKNIHRSEIPKVVRTEISALSVADTKKYFNRLEELSPHYAGLFALVAFGGFRLAEAQRLKPESINWDRKEILLPFKDSKTGQTWLQSDMPDNIWKWLEKYPPSELWAKKMYEDKKLRKGLNFDRNALRHSFATYHLSLYRDAPKTSIMLRHTNPNQLWQTYLAGLNSEDEAKKYFSIVPKE